MSALAGAAILARDGIEPVLQFTVRDRNRMALQGDLLGAAALGIPNILCLHGDDPTKGDQPETKPVYDIDSRALMTTARRLRDEGTLPSGREGRAARRGSSSAAPTRRSIRSPTGSRQACMAKLEAGADFVQTQYCFDPALLQPLSRAARRARDPGARLHPGRHRPHRLGEIGALDEREPVRRAYPGADPRAGSTAPPIRRPRAASICVELLQELAEIEGVAGAHLMAPRQEAAIAAVIAESGLLKKRRAACDDHARGFRWIGVSLPPHPSLSRASRGEGALCFSALPLVGRRVG